MNLVLDNEMNVHTAKRDHDVLDIVNAICLTTGNVWRREPAGRGVEVLSLDGDIWITEEGNPNDYLLRAGQSILFPGPGLIVVEPLTPFACIRIYEGEQAGRHAGAETPASEVPPIGIEA
jgi:hypothetical protein